MWRNSKSPGFDEPVITAGPFGLIQPLDARQDAILFGNAKAIHAYLEPWSSQITHSKDALGAIHTIHYQGSLTWLQGERHCAFDDRFGNGGGKPASKIGCPDSFFYG